MLRATKPPKCKHCRKRTDRIGKPLHDECQDAWIAGQIAKQQRRQKAAERVQTRQRRTALETIPELIAAADKAFAAFVRERDRQAGYACISSGRPLDWSGNQVDAGHYRSRGAASHLRYHQDNCHAQSKHDNRHLAGNAVNYRIGLIARIGMARVEALEADNEPHRWTREELRGIAVTYRAKLKALKASTQP